MKYDSIIKTALKEDSARQDITTLATISSNAKSEAYIVAESKGILAGIDIAERVFRYFDRKIRFKKLKKDGSRIKPRQKIAKISGKTRTILSCERTALNFLQYLSGIATETSRYAEKVKGTKASVFDTRKTVPGFRELAKYAVRVGGGKNHRMNLSSSVLIKDNHIQAAGSVGKAVQLARKKYPKKTLEIEVQGFAQLKQVLQQKVDIIMLDNMNLNSIKKAVKLIRAENKKIKIEVSGGINIKNIRSIAKTGVDMVSVGTNLTLSGKALSFSLDIK